MAKLYFYYSSMNAGKSTTLLQADFNYRERGMQTMLWTAELDDRYDRGVITSRIGLEAEAHLFRPETDILVEVQTELKVRPVACMMIDEAQFLTKEQGYQCAAVADELGIPVICYGLRTDFRGDLFPGSAILLGIADSLSEIKAVCHCGNKSTMNLRVDGDGVPIREGEQTQVGGNERYVAMCRKHFMQALG